MKSFNQFLSKAYLCEAQVTQSGAPSTGQAPVTYGRTAPGGRFRSPGEQQAYEATSRREAQQRLSQSQRGPTGAAVRPYLQFQSSSSSAPEIAATNDIASRTNQPTVQPSTTTVSRQQMTASAPTSTRPALPPAGQSGQGFQQRLQQIAQQRQQARAANAPGSLATRSVSTPSAPVGTPSNPQRINPTPIPSAPYRPPTSTASASQPSGARAPRPSAAASTTSPSRGRAFRGALGALSGAGALYSASQGDIGGAAEQGLLAAASSNRLNQGAARLGQRGVQSAATRLGVQGAGKIAARFVPGLQTAYGLYRGTSALNKGDYLGAALGYGSAIPVVGGAVAAADIARDVIDDPEQRYKRIGAQGVRSARQVAAKSGQYGARYGSAVTGGGGNTFVSRDAKGNAFISTGGGRNRVTTQLARTQLVRDPKTGKQVVGDLAFRGGKATYLARPSIASRDTNLWSRFSRWSGIGGQRQADAAAARREYRTALANTQRYQKAIKGKK